jgi:5-methylcytosine-specific restriction endonuclease McrA
VPTEAIDATVIYERDEWKCGICGGKVAQDLRYPDPRSASLDHVVPLAEGGSHTAANVRCSHLECNVRRGTRGEAEQLRMVG